MKFAQIIRNAGLDTEQYPNSANIQTTLYDGKDRINSEETVRYVEPFFTHNEGSLLNFKLFLSGIEKETITSMNVKVDEYSVVLFYKTTQAIVFSRKNSMYPLDYMD